MRSAWCVVCDFAARAEGAEGEEGGTENVSKPQVPRPLPDVLPILGLSDIVIFPGMVAPLLVDTAQSIRLIDDVVEGDRLLGLVLQKKPEVDSPAPEDLYEGIAGRGPVLERSRTGLDRLALA